MGNGISGEFLKFISGDEGGTEKTADIGFNIKTAPAPGGEKKKRKKRPVGGPGGLKGG